jgi:hypothetical protein
MHATLLSEPIGMHSDVPEHVPVEWLGEFDEVLPRQATEPGPTETRDVQWVESKYKGLAISADDLLALSEDDE